jgi:hypothetical protein
MPFQVISSDSNPGSASPKKNLAEKANCQPLSLVSEPLVLHIGAGGTPIEVLPLLPNQSKITQSVLNAVSAACQFIYQ